MTVAIRPPITNPPHAPTSSIAAPTTGELAAPPIVNAVPCQPIASPRRSSGTSLAIHSAAAVMVGAHKKPVGMTHSDSDQTSPPRPTGIVVRPRANRRYVGRIDRLSEP